MSEPSKLKSTIMTETDEWGRKKYRIEQHSEGEEEQPAVVAAEGNGQKSLLVGREEDLNIEKYIGRIEKNKKSKKREVFFCEVCKEGFKCDMAYITHLNSPHHNRKLGMSMKVKAVSTETVIEKLKNMKKDQPSIEEREMTRFHQNAFVKKYQEKKEEEEAKEKVEEGNEDEALANNEEQSEEDDMEAQMRALGLPTAFSSKKQKR